MLDDYIHLLHRQSFGVLATHSEALPGFPFASVLPFAPDAQQRPIFLISRLAEHTRNLEQDPKASLLLCDINTPDVLLNARATVIGTVEQLPHSDALQRRYLQYQRAAEQYIGFGDFQFYRLNPTRIRYVAGFGRMGWVEGDALATAATIDGEDDEQMLDYLGKTLPAHVELIGIDPWGVDYRREGQRQREDFARAPLKAAELEDAIRTALSH